MCRVNPGVGDCDLTCCAVDCRLVRCQQKPHTLTGSKRRWLWEVADVAQAAVHSPPADLAVLRVKLRECFEKEAPQTGAADITVPSTEANCLHEIYRLAGRVVNGHISYEELLEGWGRLVPQLEQAHSRLTPLPVAA